MLNNMEVCQEFAKLSHLDCGNCNSENVTLLGNYKLDETGFYVEIKCNNCSKVSDSGDGEFLVEVAKFDGTHFHPINEQNKIPTVEEILCIALQRVKEAGKWLSEDGSDSLFSFDTNTKDYTVCMDMHSEQVSNGEYVPMYRIFVTSFEDGTQEDKLIENPTEALQMYEELISKYN